VTTFSLITSTTGPVTLTCVRRPSASVGNTNWAAADIATINALIQNDLNATTPSIPASLSYNGVLFVPNMGHQMVLPGDIVWADTNGGCGIITAHSYAAANFWVAPS
jgi:hypothetical protein